MQNRKYVEMASMNPIGNDVRRAPNDQFARIGFSTGVPEVRMPGEPLDGSENPLSQPAGGFGFVLCDELLNLDEVRDCRGGPNYSHDGGGSSRFLPHERSQRAVFSCDTTRPSRTSFFPFRMLASCHS